MSASNNFYKKPRNASIKERIYLSFSVLVALFVINGIITIITLNKSHRLSTHLSKVVDPTLESLADLRKMMQQSDIYTTNSVFFNVRAEDKMLLKKLYTQDYPALKSRINIYSSKWQMKSWVDSLNKVFTGFEELLAIENSIMENLNDTKETERGVEEEVIPRGDKLRASLKTIRSHWLSLRTEENETVERSSKNLKLLIIFSAAAIILLGIFLSLYMTRKIINPINKIRHIVNDLGKGIIKKVDHKVTSDEIGEMVRSVNNLSEKLQGTAAFAAEIGNRNFDSYFEPLGMKDTLGKALVAMRDNLKQTDESLNEAQHIAKLGSWDWNLVTNELFWSDEVYNIFEIDPKEFLPSYEGYLSFVHPEDREHTNSIVTKCLTDHHPFSYELRIVSGKNVTKIICAEGKISKNDRGELVKLTGIVQDITERKKAQKELEDVNRELSILFNSIDEIFFSVNMTTLKVIQISATCEKVCGYKQSEFLAKYGLWSEIIHPDDKHIIENEDEIMRRGEQVNNQYRIIRKDKIICCVETNITPTLDEDGNLIRIDGVIRDITERKNAEEALRESEKRLREIIDLVPHFIFAKDAKGKFILANEAVARAYGSTVEDLIGKNDTDFNSNKEEAEHFMREDLEVINSGIAKYNIEETVTDATGNVRILSTTKIPYTFPGIDIPGLIGVSVDISERKKAETVLKESEGQLSIATQIAKLGYWEFDVLKGLFTFNDQFYSIYKTTTEEVGGNTMTSDHYAELFVYSDDRAVVSAEMGNAINSADPHFSNHMEHRIIYANGEIGWMSVHFYLVKDDEGHTIKTFGVNQDITGRKNAETELHKSEERYRQIVETAQEGIWMIDENNNTIFVNKKMGEMLGYSTEEIMEKKIHSFFGEEAYAQAKAGIEKRKQGKGETYDLKFITKSGSTVWTSITSNPILDNAGKHKGSLAMITDITKRKHDEESIQKSQVNLEKNNRELERKNKELEQFAYVASHDLQEPLRTITSFVQIFKQQYLGKLDPKTDRYLNYIVQASDRMRVLIKDLLDFSRIGYNKDVEQVDCNIILQEVIADIDKAIKDSDAKIKAEYLPVISGYATELKQLFQNLILNSIKFRKKNVPLKINIVSQKKNDDWQFAFTDNGIGIDQQHNERIFIIFQRLHTRSEYKGSGIGLSHCKKIVELHHGKIWVESTPNEGSTFYFTIHSPKQKINEPKIKLQNAN